MKEFSSVLAVLKIYILGVFLMLGYSGFSQKGSQSFGLEYSKNAYLLNDLPLLNAGYGIGLAYEWQFTRRLGLRSGLTYANYKLYRSRPFFIIEPANYWSVYSTNYLEIPLDITINLDYFEDSKQKGFFVIGYGIGTNISSSLLEEHDGKLEEFAKLERIIGSESLLFKGRVGLKFEHQVKTKFKISWGILCEFGWINVDTSPTSNQTNQSDNLSSSYREFSQCKLFLGFSRKKFKQ